jgi:CelD/BcsL family acetyltransferase involved in cellulose biosynthesis
MDLAMTVAAAIDSRTADVSARLSASRVTDIDLVYDLSAAEAIWGGLQTPEQFFTPYQQFDFLSIWQRDVGARDGVEPFIVIAYDIDRRPLMLVPLGLKLRHGVRTASFMGGKHTTFNMALWNREFATTVTAADLEALLSKLRAHGAADVLALTQQPRRWHDLANPFAMLPHQESVNLCPVTAMTPGAGDKTPISNSLRKRLRTKERKFQSLPGYRYHVAASDGDIARLLDWFFRVKPLRMAEQKLPNVFAEDGVEDFIRGACMAKNDGHRVIEIHALECDEEVIALYAGVADGQRFSMMFNTYTMSEHARYSPGLILMRNIVDHYASLGYRALDLGIGSDDYKRMFCKDDEPIFDSFIALSARGRMAAATMSAINHGKYLVKQNRALFQLAQRLRGAFH